MGRRPKQGLDFSAWDVDIFENDTKIDTLLDAQGWNGFAIYFYLCQRAYASEGYFYRWSYANAATTARRMGGGIGSETVRQTVGACLQIGLFDKRLFDLGGVLTSRGIQRRYAEAIQRRDYRVVNKEYWLLDPEETKGFKIIPKNADSLPGNEDFRNGNNDSRNGNADFLPYSKVKESKVEDKPLSGAAKPQKGDTERYVREMGFPQPLEEAVLEWLKYKSEKRQAYKETGLKNLLGRIRKEAGEAGPEAVAEAIRFAMSSNYSGIVWDKIREKKEQTGGGKTKFSNFPERKYDFDDYERQLLQAQQEET